MQSDKYMARLFLQFIYLTLLNFVFLFAYIVKTQTVVLSSQTTQYKNRVDVRGNKYVFDPTNTHFRPMNSEKGQKHIYAQEHQLYYYYNKFKGQYTA